ncbi:MAG: NDP-sugar synthase [Sulfolobales archaeon]
MCNTIYGVFIVMIRYAIIPLGGLGTRLYPLTVETSKAMIRFLNRPLIEFIIYKLASQGVREIYLGVSGYVNYRTVYDYLGEGYRVAGKYNMPQSFRVRYQPLEESVGNADSVRIVLEYYDIRSPVLVVQGDTVFDLELVDLWRYHVDRESFMTIALKEIEKVEDLKEFGVAMIEDDGRIRGFVEKPQKPEEIPSKLVNTGIYLLSEEFRSFISSPRIMDMRSKGLMDFGRDIIPLLIASGARVYGYSKVSYWFDIGNPKRYLEAVYFLLKVLSLEELEVTEVWNGVRFQGKSSRSKSLHREIIRKAEEKRIKLEGDILIGRHVSIGDWVAVRDAVIDNYTIISDGAVIEGSVIMDRSYIGRGSHIINSIIGRHVKIGSNVFIEGSVIGDDVKIGDNSRIIKSKIWPHRELDPMISMENISFK